MALIASSPDTAEFLVDVIHRTRSLCSALTYAAMYAMSRRICTSVPVFCASGMQRQSQRPVVARMDEYVLVPSVLTRQWMSHTRTPVVRDARIPYCWAPISYCF